MQNLFQGGEYNSVGRFAEYWIGTEKHYFQKTEILPS